MSMQVSPKSEPADPKAYAGVLARNLVIARATASVTQHVLAKRSRISRATIAQIERGTSDPRLSTVVMLANALAISPLDLLMSSRGDASTQAVDANARPFRQLTS